MASRDRQMPAAFENRPVARMTPVILDHGRFDLRMPAIHADRGSGQAVLVGVLGVALAAILIARPPGEAGAATGAASASPTTSAEPPEGAVASASPVVQPTEAVSTAEPVATPGAETADPGSRPAATSGPTTSGATYKVKSGDTLSAIAARFDTTVSVLVDLNRIADPSRLRIGQILNLP